MAGAVGDGGVCVGPAGGWGRRSVLGVGTMECDGGRLGVGGVVGADECQEGLDGALGETGEQGGAEHWLREPDGGGADAGQPGCREGDREWAAVVVEGLWGGGGVCEELVLYIKRAGGGGGAHPRAVRPA